MLLHDIEDNRPEEKPLFVTTAVTTVAAWFVRVVCPRFATLLLADLTKVFLSGFCWQLGGFVAEDALSLSDSSAWFALLTGLGDGAGVFLGTILFDVCLFLAFGKPSLGRVSFVNALVLAFGGLCSGSAWQPMLNLVTTRGSSFVMGSSIVGAVCGGSFLAGITVVELLRMHLASRDVSVRARRRKFLRAVYFAATLSLAIAGSAAAFVGTDARYHGNFLQGVVGERDHSSNVSNCLKAGCATALGFLAVESVLNVVAPPGMLWLDEQESPIDDHPAGSSRGSSLVFGPSLNMDLLDSERPHCGGSSSSREAQRDVSSKAGLLV